MSDEERAPLLDDASDPAASSSLGGRLSTAFNQPGELTGLEKALAALAVFLLLLAATGFGLFVGEAVKLHQHHHEVETITSTVTVTPTSSQPGPTSSPPSPPRPPPRADEVCLTSTCVTVASTVITSLDTTVDPCDNFYLFANGGWLESHPIPEGQGFFGSAQDIGVRNKRTILEILDSSPDPSLPEADLNNIHHLQSFYASCLDESALESVGVAPLVDVVKQVIGAWRGEKLAQVDRVEQTSEGFKVVTKNKSGRWDPATRRDRLTAAFMYLHSRGIPAIFEVYPEGDVAVDPKTLVLWLKQSGLGLPSEAYYKDPKTEKLYTDVVKSILVNIYTALEEDVETDTDALSLAVVAFEKKLAKISLDPEDLEDPKGTYNRKNSTELSALLPLVSFPDYFASFTPRPSYPDPVIVTSPAYLEGVTSLLEGLEEDVLEAYFVFMTAQTYGPLLGPKSPIRKSLNHLDNFLGGIDADAVLPRGDVCLASLLDNYGFLIGRYYVQKAFGGASKNYAEDVIVATIQAFKDRLPELDWLDDETRQKAEEKADAITHKIGYPKNPDTENPAALERYYSINLPISVEDFFGNVLRSKLAEQRRSWVMVGHQMDKGMWDMIPSEVNAYYQPSANEIAFPAGILQSPYFSKDWPEYMRFGAFGSVAGHELSHAFDQAGRQYDKDGKLTDWWTNATVAHFEELQSCLLEQYANYTVLSETGEVYHINSKFTNGEDMADAGGLAQSFRAWSDRFDSDEKGERYDNYLLPGLDFTREQLFFIAYAQGWARNIKPAEAVKRIRTDPHSPTNYRVIGPLSNDLNFQKAFGCKTGQPMSNIKKCAVW